MKYDFDQPIERRGTNSTKWDSNVALFGRDDVLDMWVADMDLPCPEPVAAAIRKRAEHPIYGYTFPHPELYQAIISHLDRYYGWRVKQEWIVFTAGVVNGLYSAVQAFSHPGDEVIVQPPVYYPFFSAIRESGRQVLENPLAFDGDRYTMDFANLERAFDGRTTFPMRTPKAKLMMLCNPHNPVGRAWTADELRELGRICLANDCIILSDEIHCDLLVKGTQHTVTASLSPELEQRTITFMSASKTFNLAGLATAFVVIPNADLRREFVSRRAGHNSGNLFGFTALEAAFRHGDDYLAQLRDYLTGNLHYFLDFVATRIPRIKAIRPEATYLVWVDMRGLGMDDDRLQQFLHDAGLAFDDGFAFGRGGSGFQRINLACPRSYVEEACRRLERAINGI
ncbi:MAG: MalY/PatB family protein [Chloroflexota bacterium]